MLVVRFSERLLLLELLSSPLLRTLLLESPLVSLFSDLSEMELLTLRELHTDLIRLKLFTLLTPFTLLRDLTLFTRIITQNSLPVKLQFSLRLSSVLLRSTDT